MPNYTPWLKNACNAGTLPPGGLSGIDRPDLIRSIAIRSVSQKGGSQNVLLLFVQTVITQERMVSMFENGIRKQKKEGLDMSNF